ncbi:Uncharacterised protein [uncultured archaeon]|nr:Uncharacterised protein [uncultured archaeon]
MGRVLDVGQAISKARVERILADMRAKMVEIDDLRKELGEWQGEEATPEKSLAMLEEIKVPSLESIREEKKKA